MLKPKISLKRQDFDFSGVQGNFVTKRVSEKSVTDPDTTAIGTETTVTDRDKPAIDQDKTGSDLESTVTGSKATATEPDTTATVATMVEFGSIK